MLYFAYGSNLNSARLAERVGRLGTVKALHRARLHDWRLAINKPGGDGTAKATITHAPGEVVWGVVYELNREQIRELDRYEGGYDRCTVQVVDDEHVLLIAEAYISEKRTEDIRVTTAYRQLLIDGAREHGLPEEVAGYFEGLEVVD